MHPDTWYHLFGSPIMTDAVWCIPTRGINYSVLPSCRMPFSTSRHVVSIIRFSHHVGCRLVHPDTWYQLFGSPIMSDAFSASRHVVSIIRFSHHVGCRLVHPNTWYQLFSSPIMLGAVWCTPTRGINYSVSHHVGCRLVHPNTWYQLFGLPSCWMPFGAPQHVVSIIRSPIMLDAVWCTPTRGINYSVLPSCWMPFGAPQHVVSIIRSPIMLDAVWCTPTRGIN